MPRFNDDIFWNEYQHFSDLSNMCCHEQMICPDQVIRL